MLLQPPKLQYCQACELNNLYKAESDLGDETVHAEKPIPHMTPLFHPDLTFQVIDDFSALGKRIFNALKMT